MCLDNRSHRVDLYEHHSSISGVTGYLTKRHPMCIFPMLEVCQMELAALCTTDNQSPTSSSELGSERAFLEHVMATNERLRQIADAERRTLNLAIEQAAESIIITDPEGTITYVNPSFETA